MKNDRFKEHKRLLAELVEEEAILDALNGIANIQADEQMYHEVLNRVLSLTSSKFGVFGYINEDGAFKVPSMTEHIWDKCQVPDKKDLFPREEWGDSSWPRAIREKRMIYSNEPSEITPGGHIGITRHVSLPIIYRDKVIGLIQVANKETDYTEKDFELLAAVERSIAPILNARLTHQHTERELADMKRRLERLEEGRCPRVS